jgi:hypothetical protein
MFYATRDTHDSGDSIAEGAEIIGFGEYDDAIAYVSEGIDLEPGERIVVEPGEYGDCWLKLRSDPQGDDFLFEPFTPDQVSIQRPGQHPGGRAYWVTPYPKVYIARIETD